MTEPVPIHLNEETEDSPPSDLQDDIEILQTSDINDNIGVSLPSKLNDNMEELVQPHWFEDTIPSDLHDDVDLALIDQLVNKFKGLDFILICFILPLF